MPRRKRQLIRARTTRAVLQKFIIDQPKLDTLPLDIVRVLSAHLNLLDLSRLASVNKHLNHLVNKLLIDGVYISLNIAKYRPPEYELATYKELAKEIYLNEKQLQELEYNLQIVKIPGYFARAMTSNACVKTIGIGPFCLQTGASLCLAFKLPFYLGYISPRGQIASYIGLGCSVSMPLCVGIYTAIALCTPRITPFNIFTLNDSIGKKIKKYSDNQAKALKKEIKKISDHNNLFFKRNKTPVHLTMVKRDVIEDFHGKKTYPVRVLTMQKD